MRGDLKEIMNQMQYNKELPIDIHCEILVIGGSQSGVAAAVSAARANPKASIHLIEQFGNLGGQSVNTMVCHWEFREYTNNKGQVIAKGIGKEMIEKIVAKGNSDPLYTEWLEGKGPPFTEKADPRAYGDMPLDVEDIKLTMQEMCDEAGVKVHLFTKLLDVHHIVGENGLDQPKVAIVGGLYDIYGIEAKIFIDCTANNDVAWKIQGEEGVVLPKSDVMPMQVYAWFGGVDYEKFITAVWDHRDWWQLVYPDDKEQMFEHMREQKSLVLRGGANYLNEAYDQYPDEFEQLEEFCSPIIYYWLKPVSVEPILVEGKTHYDSTWAIEGPISFDSQIDQHTVSDFQQQALRATHLLHKIHTVLPGWENSYVERTSPMMGLRKTRILKGLYQLTAEDVKEGRTHPDVIGRAAGHDISRHNPQYEFGYDIPYRSLIPITIDALLVGARSISCHPTEKQLIALNAHRGIAATITVSQACGIAAGLCIAEKIQPRELEIEKLQDELRNQDVVLDPPEKSLV